MNVFLNANVDVAIHELTHGLGLNTGFFDYSDSVHLKTDIIAPAILSSNTKKSYFAAISVYDSYIPILSNLGALIGQFLPKNMPEGEYLKEISKDSRTFSAAKLALAYAESGKLEFKTKSGLRVPLFSPRVYSQGSSISHVNSSLSDSAEFLMVPAIPRGEDISSIMKKYNMPDVYGPMVQGMMESIGYQTKKNPTQLVLKLAKSFGSDNYKPPKLVLQKIDPLPAAKPKVNVLASKPKVSNLPDTKPKVNNAPVPVPQPQVNLQAPIQSSVPPPLGPVIKRKRCSAKAKAAKAMIRQKMETERLNKTPRTENPNFEQGIPNDSPSDADRDFDTVTITKFVEASAPTDDSQQLEDEPAHDFRQDVQSNQLDQPILDSQSTEKVSESPEHWEQTTGNPSNDLGEDQQSSQMEQPLLDSQINDSAPAEPEDLEQTPSNPTVEAFNEPESQVSTPTNSDDQFNSFERSRPSDGFIPPTEFDDPINSREIEPINPDPTHAATEPFVSPPTMDTDGGAILSAAAKVFSPNRIHFILFMLTLQFL